ncbi:MAG: Rpn family recombination-promoting nuclease/putative transposase [Fibrobacter sp.]|nr:Rpn family recombination-promoting nuclease/putative transposase [Fibrobacter sp.]
MIREEFAEFLKELRIINDNGGDVDAFVKKYEHRNVYFYNDGCIKKILASEKNIMLTTDLVNAALGLIGSDCIMNPKLVNPFIPGELGYHDINPDIGLINDRGKDAPRDRISIEVQHNMEKFYRDRLVLYVARITSNMVKSGNAYQLENLNVVSFQFFNAFPESANYRHTVQLKNQEQQVYFDKQTVTLIEVEKFLNKARDFAGDTSRLAQWLRAIDTLNREADISEFANDPVFRLLQNEVKLCNFSSRYLMTVDMSDFDRAVARHEAKEEIAKKMRDKGADISFIAETTGLSEELIRKL